MLGRSVLRRTPATTLFAHIRTWQDVPGGGERHVYLRPGNFHRILGGAKARVIRAFYLLFAIGSHGPSVVVKPGAAEIL